MNKGDIKYPNEWLLRFELYQNNHHLKHDWVKDLKDYLINYNKDNYFKAYLLIIKIPSIIKNGIK